MGEPHGMAPAMVRQGAARAGLVAWAWFLRVGDAATLRAELARRGISVATFRRMPMYRENLEHMPWLAELGDQP